jgi:protein SCO1/2
MSTCISALALAAVLHAPAKAPTGEDAIPPRSAAARWGAEYFPNVELTSHEGQHVRFFDDLVRDKVVVISFIYTNCPDACPLETARLVAVQEVLGERVGRDVFFYSISIDPARDTVEALAQYASRFRAGPGWLFLRGREEDVRLLRAKLGVLCADETELADHSLSVVIGNQATGRWMRRSPFENAFVLADEIGAWLHNWKTPTVVDEDYADAPELRSVSRGESLFRTRCSACHAIGAGDGLARSGPNLAGVVEWRDRAWLERWIREPERMLAEGDELARTLYEAYQRVPMPNMRLNELEVAAVLAYVQEESARVLAIQTPSPRAGGCCLARDEAPAAPGAGPPAPEQPRATPPAHASGWPAGPVLALVLGLLLCAGTVAFATGQAARLTGRELEPPGVARGG